MGRASSLKYVKYGVWDGLGLGTGIAPLRPPQDRTTPGTPPRTMPVVYMTSVLPRGRYPRLNIVVGLKSVDQLSLSVQISGSRTITEVYNLVEIGRIINHFSIPGTK